MKQETEVELAALKEQLKSIQSAIEDIKSSIDKLLVIDRTVAEVAVRQGVQEEHLTKLTTRVDAAETVQVASSGYLNKIKGAVALAVAILGILQAVLVAGCGWLLSSVIETQADLRAVQQSVRYLEADQYRVYGATLEKRDLASKDVN